MYFQPVFQSCSEVMGDRKVWGQSETCNLQGLINGMLTYWLDREAETRVLGVFPGREDLENGVPCQVGGHSLLGPLCVFADCVSEVL